MGQIGAGGATTFTFDRGEVSGWRMEVQGTLERILDSVIPHEVNHTIFASHFRRPLPRWADEGAATLVEHISERKRQETTLSSVIRTSGRIPLNELLGMSEYPQDKQKVYTLYAEGYSLADYLVRGAGDNGRATFLKFLADAHEHDWAPALKQHYGFKSVAELEQKWTGWVLAGSPDPSRRKGKVLVDNSGSTPQGNTAPPAMPSPKSQIVVASAPPETAPSNSDNSALASNLPPLPPITRGLRPHDQIGTFTAPAPSEFSGPVVRGQSPQGDQRHVEAPLVDRVIPRRDPHPDSRWRYRSRMQDAITKSGQNERIDLVESARTVPDQVEQPPTPSLSPDDGRHLWEQHSQFPGNETRAQGAPSNPSRLDRNNFSFN